MVFLRTWNIIFEMIQAIFSMYFITGSKKFLLILLISASHIWPNKDTLFYLSFWQKQSLHLHKTLFFFCNVLINCFIAKIYIWWQNISVSQQDSYTKYSCFQVEGIFSWAKLSHTILIFCLAVLFTQVSLVFWYPSCSSTSIYKSSSYDLYKSQF